jgi:serine/threonine protein kinase/tetratricopeptide (TPR) repeat protein
MVEIIAQRYRIESELGQGGMGTVYRGLDTHTNQTVAIKHLKPELTAPELIERFKREGEALRELNHPNIVKMLDAVEEDASHYLIIEYLAGGDLADLLKQGNLPLEKVLQIAIDICDALTRAHRLSIIHRDLKPANVLIAADGTPRLTDFGIAHFAGKARVTASDAIVGTVDYLAPEILDGELADPRADIWAFGVMLFEMLAGNRPFTGQSLAQTLMAIVTQPIPDLEALCPETPIALVDLVYRMLQKDPHARITSVRHVGAALEDILKGRSTDKVAIVQTDRFVTPTPDFLQRAKHNLPAQTTPFVGRESELSELTKLLDNPKIRLITIVAQGGMGKTRLALELAEQYSSQSQLLPEISGRGFKDGTYFVELAPLSDPHSIIPAIAEATGYQFQSDGRDQKQQVLDFLSNKNMLLLLDNYEHLMEGASLVTDILKAAPNVKILTTSRQRLSQSGETVFNLEGMDSAAWETPDDALEYAAAKLFLQGAKRAKPDFEITADNMDAIARICKLVEGLPLGILLAASWVAMLSAEEIASEITKSLDFLGSDLSDMPERQRSMRAVFDYSWDLMTDDERAVFMKLAVFRGGFTREAAEAVAGANLRTLMSLLNKSLIRRDAQSGRYDIHELLRQYVNKRLENAAQIEPVIQGMTQFYIDMMEHEENYFLGASFIDALTRIKPEIDNIHVVLQWAFHNNLQMMSRLASSLWLFWDSQGLYDEGQEWLQRSLQETAINPPQTLAKLYYGLSNFLYIRGNYQSSLELAQLSLENYQLVEDKKWIARTVSLIGAAQIELKQWSEAQISLDTAIHLSHETKDYWCLGASLGRLAQVIEKTTNNEDVESLILQGISYLELSGDMRAIAYGFHFLGSIYARKGALKKAQDAFGKSLTLFRGAGDRRGEAISTGQLGAIAMQLSNFQEAVQYQEAAYKISYSIGDRRSIALASFNLSLALYELSQYRASLDYCLHAISIFRTWSSNIRYQNSLLIMSKILVALQKPEQATTILSLLESLGIQPELELQTLIIQIRKMTSEKVFVSAWEHAKSLDLGTVVQELLEEFGESEDK